MTSAVAALSSLEESLFATRSVLTHAKDISQSLALVSAHIAPSIILPSRSRLVPASAINRARTLSQARHDEYLNLVFSEGCNQVDGLGDLIQDHRERLDYHLFLIDERFRSAKIELDQKNQSEMEMLNQQIRTKKAELNRLYNLKEASASCNHGHLDSARLELQRLRTESVKRNALLDRIRQQREQLELARNGDAKELQRFQSQLGELNVKINRVPTFLDRDSILKQVATILRACGASSYSIRAMKRIVANGFTCRLADFDSEFPIQSASAQQALKSTLAELQGLGLVHFVKDDVVAVGQPSTGAL